MFGAVAFLASQEWRDQGCPGPEDLAAAFDAYTGQLTAAVAGHWSTGLAWAGSSCRFVGAGG
jgi:hypothetical protein